MLKQRTSGGWSEERSRCIWSSGRRQHERWRGSPRRVSWRRQKKVESPIFHFLFLWTVKCRRSHLSPLLVCDRDQVVTRSLSACVVRLQLSAFTSMGFEMETAFEIHQFKPDWSRLEPFRYRWDFFLLCRWRNVEEPIEYTIDSKVPFSPESSPRSE